MSRVFSLSSLLVLPFWALMMIAPRWRWTRQVVRSPFVIAVPAVLYTALVVPRLSEIWPAVTRPTLTGIVALLGSPAGATIAWVHFLAFDLFVGRWIYLDARERGIGAWLISPILFLTLMIGPAGFLLYLIVRSAVRNQEEVSPPTVDAKDDAEERALAAVGRIARQAIDPLRKSIAHAFVVNRPLTISAVAMLCIFLATLVGVIVDHRVITGAPAWLKPAKFAISIAVYCFTLVWLLGFVENRPRLVRWVADVTVAGLIVEMLIILAQAARGTTSHFNMSTSLDASLWIAMGTFILLVWVANLLLAIVLMRQRMPDRAFALSLRLGVAISSIGMAVAFLMTAPTAQQPETIRHHGPGGVGVHSIGAHSVGVADGGPGLPLVGWSTVGGDLRVAHFAGLHALQVLPFFGWLLTRKRSAVRRLGERQRLALVWTGGLAYLGMVLLLVWQALRGQSLIHPDAKTIAAAVGLAAGTAISVLVIVVRAWCADRTTRGPVPAQDKLVPGGHMKGAIGISALAVVILTGNSFGQDATAPAANASPATASVPDTGSRATEAPAGTTASAMPSFPASSPSSGLRIGDKFGYYVVETYLNPAALIAPAIGAGTRMANPPGKDPTRYPREWRQGAEAFGRNYGDAVARRVSFHTARFVTGVITRENPNYVPSAGRSFFARSFHAFGYTFFDQSDSGRLRPAISNFAGAAAGGFVGNAYLPAGFNNVSHAGQRAALQLGIFAAGNLFREFAPQIPGPIRTFFTLIAR